MDRMYRLITFDDSRVFLVHTSRHKLSCEFDAACTLISNLLSFGESNYCLTVINWLSTKLSQLIMMASNVGTVVWEIA